MIKIIRNIKELQKIEPEWNALLSSCPNENIFQSYEWNYLWVKYFAASGKLFVIAVYNGTGELEAVAPFFIKRFFLFFKSLMFISYDYSDYLDIVARNCTDKERIYPQILDAILKHSKSSIISLKQVSEPLLDIITKNIQGNNNLNINYKESGDCYFVDLPAGIEDYIAQFNSKQRYNILSRVEKAEKNAVTFLSSSSLNKSSFNSFLNNFFDLHQKRWNEKGKRGVFYNKKIRGFFTDLFTSLFNKGTMALSFLVSGNPESIKSDNIKVISSAACFDFGNKRQVYLPGFDTEYSNLHPGIVLTYHLIKESIEKKYEEFDFLKGSEEYKQRFRAVKRKNFKAYIFQNKIIFFIYKAHLFIENEIKEKLRDLIFKIK